MNFSFLIGIIIGVGSIIWAVFSEASSPQMFLNTHAIVIVFACTFGVAVTCFGFKHILNMVSVLFKIITGYNKKVQIKTMNEILEAVRLKREGKTYEEISQQVSHPFLIDCLNIISRDLLSEDEIKDVMAQRIYSQHLIYQDHYKTFKVISKFPPAFGLIGATLGMINLLQGLGQSDAFNNIGPAMSSALTATFWGLILSNIFLIPIGENLELSSDQDIKLRQIIADGIEMIMNKNHPLMVQEKLKSHIAPNEYVAFDKMCAKRG